MMCGANVLYAITGKIKSLWKNILTHFCWPKCLAVSNKFQLFISLTKPYTHIVQVLGEENKIAFKGSKCKRKNIVTIFTYICKECTCMAMCNWKDLQKKQNETIYLSGIINKFITPYITAVSGVYKYEKWLFRANSINYYLSLKIVQTYSSFFFDKINQQ